ncbi:MAG: SDR family oxidoreductase [Acidobacteriota bacterium]
MNESPIALVTGGSRGIGLAIVSALATAGWRVHFCSRREQSVEDALSTLPASQVSGRAVDVRQQSEVDAFVEHVVAAEGRLDCLVNNAGIGRFAPVDEIRGDEWRELLEINLHGAFYFLRAAAPTMRRQGSGWIFNIASLAGRHAFAGGAAYNASKFGLVALSEAAMLDLRQDGVRVSAILPGSVETDFGGAGRKSPGHWRLEPEDVARTVLDLLRYPDRALPSRVELRPTRTAPSD